MLDLFEFIEQVALVTSVTIFLASKASDFVNGQILFVDGGILATIGKPSNER